MAFYLIAPLVFVTLFLSMYVGLRVQMLHKEIAGLEACHESLAVQLHERRRQIAREIGYAQLEPHVRRHGLHPPERAQILALVREMGTGSESAGLIGKLLEFLTRVPEAQAHPLPVDSRAEEGQR